MLGQRVLESAPGPSQESFPQWFVRGKAPSRRGRRTGGHHRAPVWGREQAPLAPLAAYELFTTIGGGSAYGCLWLPMDFLSRLWMTTNIDSQE